ncbi:MAG: hypothetical protein NPIRA04_03230 [Nitrospirales bacterium]|nr:MAG: hypothetical protein NPIRA04_03230 [Nitrospirales bacterium]
MAENSVQTKRWTRREYYQMAETGMFQPDEHVELIDGEIITMTPQRSQHAAVIGNVEAALRQAFGDGYWVRTQMPLAVSEESDPEPDLAIVPGSPNDYLNEHPTTALLIVEVSDTTLPFDRKKKAWVYAHSQIPEYWILNLRDNQLEVFRNPQSSKYQSQFIMHAPQTVEPLHAGGSRVPVSALLLPEK